MTTYSYLQYGIKEDIIAFQPTIALGLDDFIKTYSEDEASVKSLILNSKTEGIVSVPSSSQVTLKNFLNNVNGLTVQESQTILLKVEIIDNITTTRHTEWILIYWPYHPNFCTHFLPFQSWKRHPSFTHG